MDFVGPLPSQTKTRFLLVIVDEYSRYPFAFPCSSMDTDEVIKALVSLFALFGAPSAIHSDRGTQFESAKLNNFLLRNGVVKSRTTPYHPQGNGQCERINGTILKAISLALRSLGLDKGQWELVLPQALSSIRSLLCTATNEVPHDRMFRFSRTSLSLQRLPDFLLNEGASLLHRRHTHLKGDSPTERVQLVNTVSPHFARIRYTNGRVDTVSTRDLAADVNSSHTATNEETTTEEDAAPSAGPVVNETTTSLPMEATETRTQSGRIVKQPPRLLL